MKRLIPLLLLAACSQPAPNDPRPVGVPPEGEQVSGQVIIPRPEAPPSATTPAAEDPGDPVEIARAYLTQQNPGMTVDLGSPGAQEGAAGSIYMEIPATIGGKPATVVMRRVNNVDGSTAEQRRWRVERVDPQ